MSEQVEEVEEVEEVTDWGRVVLIRHVGEHVYLIFNTSKEGFQDDNGLLATKKEQLQILEHPSTETAHSPLFTRLQPVETTLLQKPYQALVTMEFSLYDKSSKQCEGKIKDFVFFQQLDACAPSDVWCSSENSGSYPVIAAQLHVTKGDCQKALFARDAKLPAPQFAALGKVSKKESKAAIKAFRKTDLWADRANDPSAVWDKKTKKHFQSVSLGAERWIFATMKSEQDDYLNASFMLDDRSNFKFFEDGFTSFKTLLVAFDYDEDGDIDFLLKGYWGEQAWVEQKPDKLHTVFETFSLTATD